MIELLKSVTWGSGLFVLMCVAIPLGFLMARVKSAVVRWTTVVTVPFALAYTLYWAPVWLGGSSSDSEYGTWAFVAIAPWTILPAIVAITIVFVMRR